MVAEQPAPPAACYGTLGANNVLDTPALVGYARLQVLGAAGQRLHEELITAGGVLREGRFARMNVGEVQRALDAATNTPVPPTMEQRLLALWPTHEAALLQALEARMRERRESLGKLLADRAAKEVADVRTVLTELRTSILDELHVPEVEQLQLFSDPEREQWERNIDSLRARVDQIPHEIEQEAAAIKACFAAPQVRIFPVAVTFLVPERLARS